VKLELIILNPLIENQKSNSSFTTVINNPIQIGKFITLHQTINNEYSTHIQHHLWIEKNNFIYEYVFLSDKQERTLIISQILSTFKFLDNGTITPTCRPRPACLDSTPRCLIPETEDICPSSNYENKFCGGIAGIVCPGGYKCQLDGNYPDAGGKCTKF
jgi:hypothetical protein